ncbi:hypothetical protein EC957_007396 [Mortierella hygrophila]|uniref:Uncharacterized protein n=1 Tax=Mortierella hygrophila TaxID=979708 RepID=A0A9P6EY75_9FUNG|nr:hypothetical protein EC957_007396 [Mortierella hygrophila]
MEYLGSYEFDQISQLNPFQPEMVASYFESNTKEVVLYRYYHFKVDQEVLRCLSYLILEQLQSFTIQHMSTIKDYIKVAGRFRSLQQICFVISDWLESGLSSGNDKDYGIDDNDSDTKGTPNDEVIRDMFRFIQEHTRLFPWPHQDRHLLREDFLEQRWLENNRLHPIQLLAHPHSIYLSRVQELNDKGFPEFWYEEGTNHDNRLFLQRCRNLKHLKLEALHSGMFEWAVQEKKDMVRFGRNITACSSNKIHGGQG